VKRGIEPRAPFPLFIPSPYLSLPYLAIWRESERRETKEKGRNSGKARLWTVVLVVPAGIEGRRPS